MQNLQTMPLRTVVAAQLAARSATQSARARISHTGQRFASEERGEMAAWIILTLGLVAMAAYAITTLGPWFDGKVDTIKSS